MDGNNMNNEYTYAADSVYDAAPAPAGNGLAILNGTEEVKVY